MEFLLIYPFIFSNLFLYFYNLIHDQTSSMKNFLIRIMLLGFTSIFVYQAYKDDKIDNLFFTTPFLTFILLCLIKKYPLNNRYTKHMLWIYLFLFIGLILFCIQEAHFIQKQTISYILLSLSILTVSLVLYWIIDYLIHFNLT